MENKTLIAIYIPDEEARKFLIFQQYYDKFSVMIENGVFGIKNGSVALHFDVNGDLKSIHRADILYDSRFGKNLSTDKI